MNVHRTRRMWSKIKQIHANPKSHGPTSLDEQTKQLLVETTTTMKRQHVMSSTVIRHNPLRPGALLSVDLLDATQNRLLRRKFFWRSLLISKKLVKCREYSTMGFKGIFTRWITWKNVFSINVEEQRTFANTLCHNNLCIYAVYWITVVKIASILVR